MSETTPDPAWSPSWVSDIEDQQGLRVGKSTDTALAVTGEPYVAIMTGGVKSEGGLVSVYARDPSDAWRLYCQEVQNYADEIKRMDPRKPGVSLKDWEASRTLYWRTHPELIADTFMAKNYLWRGEQMAETKLYYVWSRLLISNKPRLVKVA